MTALGRACLSVLRRYEGFPTPKAVPFRWALKQGTVNLPAHGLHNLNHLHLGDALPCAPANGGKIIPTKTVHPAKLGTSQVVLFEIFI
jgi:hypothetical protein